MKARKRIIALALGVNLCVAAWTHAADQPPELTFGKYYEPYEPNIEPNAPGYALPLDLNDVINYDVVTSRLSLTDAHNLIKQHGFVVVEPRYELWVQDRDNIMRPWQDLKSKDIPFFITIDTALHLYHVQFDGTLKDIEEREFIPDINDLTMALLNDAFLQHEQLHGELQEAAKRNIAYLSVAQKLMDPNASTSQLVDNAALGELTKIEAHQGFAASDIFIYDEDYSQYVPRGHYTRSEPLKRYFKTMMWYGRMAFLLKGGPEGLVSEYDARI